MKIKFLFSLIALSFLLASCNVFDPFEPNSNHFDRCKMEADKGNLDNAIEECLKAQEEDPDNNEINVELGDIYLAKSGINLGVLAKVFDKSNTNASPVVALVESIIENVKNDNGEGVKEENITNAENSITAFDKAAASGNYSNFAGLMARLCYVALIMAHTDNDDVNTAKENGKLDPEDICEQAGCEVTVGTTSEKTFCMNTGIISCGGMSDTDAAKIANMFLNMGDALESLGIKADIGKSTDALVSQEIDVVKCTAPSTCYFKIDPSCDSCTIANPSEKQTIKWIFEKLGTSVDVIMAGAARKALYDLVKGN